MMDVLARVSIHNKHASLSVTGGLTLEKARKELGDMRNHSIDINPGGPCILNGGASCTFACEVKVIIEALAGRIGREKATLTCHSDKSKTFTSLSFPLPKEIPETV